MHHFSHYIYSVLLRLVFLLPLTHALTLPSSIAVKTLKRNEQLRMESAKETNTYVWETAMSGRVEKRWWLSGGRYLS